MKVILNKPKALNAIDLEMIQDLQGKIKVWETDKVKAVWMTGEGDKAFCAGGDIKSLYDAKKGGRIEE